MTRLQELGFTDFTGGLNVRDQRSFQIADNESPQMLNMRADERLGIYTRKGMRRWNATPVTTGTWNPRNGYEHDYADDTNAVFVTNEQGIWVAENSSTFTQLEYVPTNPVGCNADPHLADFASWGDSTYIATGRKVDDLIAGDVPIKYSQGGSVNQLTVLGVGTYNDDYTIPVGGVMPQADYTEPHAGYLFCASVREDEDGGGVADYPSRLRWSHPNSPEDWAKADFIDIEVGGGRITGLMSYQDHLLIFKTDSLWALYGYDSDSWQLIKVSPSIGTPSPTATARSPIGCFFYSASGRGDIYRYDGDGLQRISENIEQVVEEVPTNRYKDVWMGWASDVLLVSLPWIAYWDPLGGVSSVNNSLFMWDPYTGNGSWEMHRPAKGNIGPIIERSDSLFEPSLLVLFGSDVEACLLQIGAVDAPNDFIDDLTTPTPFPTRYATNWKFAGTPELRKHWMRPRYIIRNPTTSVAILVQIYRDYDESAARRNHQLLIEADGTYFWRDLGYDDPAGDGFDWAQDDGETTPAGRGGVWSGSTKGGRIIRGKSFGIARSVQVAFSTAPLTPGKEWGIDAVVLKHIDRRFTT